MLDRGTELHKGPSLQMTVASRVHQRPRGKFLKRDVYLIDARVVGFLLIWQLVLVESGNSRRADCQNQPTAKILGNKALVVRQGRFVGWDSRLLAREMRHAIRQSFLDNLLGQWIWISERTKSSKSPIDLQIRSGDKGGVAAAEPEDSTSDLLGLAKPPKWMPIGKSGFPTLLL